MSELRADKIDHGSAKRARRIKLLRKESVEMVLIVAWILFLLLVLVPWIMNGNN